MKARHPAISIEVLCRLFGMSRQAYYQHNSRFEFRVYQEVMVLDQVHQIRKIRKMIGTRKLYYLMNSFLEKEDIKMGRDAFFELLGRNALLVKKHKNKTRTTNSYHWFRRYPNLIKGNEEVLAPNQLWVSDITYLSLKDNFCYLSLVTDGYSRKILGYNLSDSLKATGTINALLMAIEQWNQQNPQLIHHSDRGIQYCCHEYVEILESYNIMISMTENGDPYENAIAERVNGILKQELLDLPFSNLKQADLAVEKAIKTYNFCRPHSSCQMLTPHIAHQAKGRLVKYWRNYYKQTTANTVNLFQDYQSLKVNPFQDQINP